MASAMIIKNTTPRTTDKNTALRTKGNINMDTAPMFTGISLRSWRSYAVPG